MRKHQKTIVPNAAEDPELALTGESFQADVAALQDFLLAHTHVSISILAQRLARIDSRLVQYLIAASKSWRERGLRLELAGLPPALEAHFATLGVSPEMIIRKAAQ